MTHWKDATSYERGKEKIPTAFAVEVDGLRIAITCAHIWFKGRWVMHCRELCFDTEPLSEGISLEEAKQEAIDKVRERLSQLSGALAKIEGKAKSA